MSHIEDYIKTKLNDEQFAAAMHTDSSSLIIAGAGSGKTRALTYKIAYLIYGKKVNPLNILAVTFTNKAANEMKERIMKLGDEFMEIPSESENNSPDFSTGDDSIDSFLDAISESSPSNSNGLTPNQLKWIGTFHSIFLKILKDDMENASKILEKHLGVHKYTKGFTILDPNDTTAIIKEVLKKTNLKEVFKPNECKGFISNQKNQGVTPKMFLNGRAGSDYDHSMGTVYEEYQKYLALSNALDFDDLLLIPYLIFSESPEILAKRIQQFHYIMVDEAQDTNWIQFELMKMMSGPQGNITLIGDDYQSIYRRRGAMMENFLNVKQYRPDIQMFKLQINYRSRPHIVHAGNFIIKKNQKQYEKEVRPHRTGNDKIVVFSHRSEMDEAANIIDFIQKMKGDKIKSRNEVAILYRTNAQSSPFEQVLVQEGIPYKIHGAYKFFDRKEIKDVIAYLNYILNPQNTVVLKRIINVPSRKIGKTSLGKIEEVAIMNNASLHEVIHNPSQFNFEIPGAAKKGIAEFRGVMNEIRTELPNMTPSELIEKLVKRIKYRAYLIKEEGSEAQADEKYDNIGQLINMADKYQQKGEEGLRSFMEEVTLMTDMATSKDEDADALKLMTLHASKGLEFPIVFIAGLEDQIFPLSGAIMDPGALEEERRLMYVGITRAENHLFLSHANSRMQRGQTKMNPPSRFLGELPEELMKSYDLGGGSGGSGFARQENYNIEEGDTVKHKLFGTGFVMETWNDLAVVKFHNPKFGLRKVEMRFLEVIG